MPHPYLVIRISNMYTAFSGSCTRNGCTCTWSLTLATFRHSSRGTVLFLVRIRLILGAVQTNASTSGEQIVSWILCGCEELSDASAVVARFQDVVLGRTRPHGKLICCSCVEIAHTTALQACNYCHCRDLWNILRSTLIHPHFVWCHSQCIMRLEGREYRPHLQMLQIFHLYSEKNNVSLLNHIINRNQTC